MKKPRYLTKSRFKIAASCPTKLFYTKKEKEYGDTNLENDFLKALAEGGFQVGELAKLYYPKGHEINTLDQEEAVRQTCELLKQDKVTIYEAAFIFKNFLVRVDIIKKDGNQIDLIEVKAKSVDPFSDESELPSLFYDQRKMKKGEYHLKSDYKNYLIDVAFQNYVVKKSFPDFQINNYLMLADKSKEASVDGLNQLFLIKQENGRSKAETNKKAYEMNLGTQLLKLVPVNPEVERIQSGECDAMDVPYLEGKNFEEKIMALAISYAEDKKMETQIGSQCKSCEFRISKKMENLGLKSGFKECWSEQTKLSPSELDQPLVLDIWNFKKSQDLIDSKIFLQKDVKLTDINPEPSDKKPGLSLKERQWIQIEKVIKKDEKPFVNLDLLKQEFDKFKYPVHFIDFETTMVAIPFNKGKRPYEQTAFQFSHHELTKDGIVSHKGEWINFKKGEFPNFNFVRALKAELKNDEGTIFRYSNHENTVLIQIWEQLRWSDEKDKDDLMSFIESITTCSKDKSKELDVEAWNSKRTMIDLCELVKDYYYDPATLGSNSIKKVLPAILKNSQILKLKYGKPIYGDKIPSKNFKNHQWLKLDDQGNVIDPYKQLPKVMDEDLQEAIDAKLLNQEYLSDGGTAMTAYTRLQFTEMSEVEANAIRNALLKYCELDTLAMVMIYEHWNDLISKSKKTNAA